MKYKLVKRENPQNRAQSKLYAQPVNDGNINQKAISAEIVALSSLSRGDVSNVIESLLEILPKYLLMNKSLKLGDFGTLRLSFSSDGVEDAKDFNTKMIHGLKVIFTPSTEFKQSLDKATYERVE